MVQNLPIERLVEGIRQLQPLEELEAKLKAKFYVGYALEAAGRWAASAEAFQEVLLELEQGGDIAEDPEVRI